MVMQQVSRPWRCRLPSSLRRQVFWQPGLLPQHYHLDQGKMGVQSRGPNVEQASVVAVTAGALYCHDGPQLGKIWVMRACPTGVANMRWAGNAIFMKDVWSCCSLEGPPGNWTGYACSGGSKFPQICCPLEGGRGGGNWYAGPNLQSSCRTECQQVVEPTALSLQSHAVHHTRILWG